MVDKIDFDVSCKNIYSSNETFNAEKNVNKYQKTVGISTLNTCLHESNDHKNKKELQNCLFASVCGIVTLVLGVVAGIGSIISWMTPSSQK